MWLLDRYGFGHKTSVFQAKFDYDTFSASLAHTLSMTMRLRPPYQRGYTKSDVNALANLTFLTQETNLHVSDRDPTEYLEAFART